MPTFTKHVEFSETTRHRFPKILILLTLTLAGVLGGISVQAQRYVNPDGMCGGNMPCYTTIQAAVDAASPGDIIYIADGTYNERVVINKSLTLDGESEAGTVLSGTGLMGTGKGILVNTSVTNVTIQDLTVQNFAGAGGNVDAGIYADGGNNNLTVQNVTIQNNVGGSGFYADGPVDNVLLDDVTSSGHTVGARGIVIWNGLKSNITITNCEVFGNNCCGIELQDGNCSGVNMSNNNVYNNGDSGMSAVGLNGSVGANTISNNILTDNGRFGIEVKNPNGATTVSGNTVTLTASIADMRDLAGIAVMRRGVLAGNADVPTGVTVTGNTVSGYVQTGTSEGFGIVIGGTNHTVTGNTVTGNDVGIQQQAGHPGYPGDGDQSNLADMYFGRDNSPIACGNTISGNDVATRDVGGPFGNGFVTNATSNETFCSIQSAITDAQTLSGHTLAVKSGSYTENVDAATPGKNISLSPGASPGCVTINGNMTLNPGDALDMELNGATACTGYDQFIVNGTVDLGGATLDLTLGYTPSGADQIMLIDNDGGDAIVDTFAQGGSITVPGAVFIINYTGGDGNDVVLQRDCGDVCVGDVIRTGNVTLSTQTLVNNFLSAGCKYTQITGNLTITGYNGSSDPITNLCNLSELVSVGGTVTIRDFNNAANPTNLNDLASLATIGDGVGTDNLVIGGSVGDQNSSFDNITLAGLTTVGNGSVTINNNPNVTTISLPALTTVGATTSHNLTVGTNGTGVTSINLPALTTVSGDVTMNNAVMHLVSAAVNLGNLTTVGDDMNLTRTAGSLNISSLQTVDALTISTNNLTALNPTALTAVGAFAITSNTMLTSINSTPASFTATSLTVTGNTALQTATIGVSATTGNVTISSNGTGVTALNLNNLGTVDGNLDMNNAAGHDVSGATPPGAAVSLNALTSVTGLFRMVRAANSVTAPNLTNVSGAFTFQRNGVTNLDAAFPELLTIGGNLNVTNNISLSECCIIPCQVQVPVDKTKTVSGNIGNCATLLIATNICKPTVFTVSAGAPGCTGTVNLSGSQNGVEYELYVDEFGIRFLSPASSLEATTP
jgi:parallel beta-helix repeat protein